ncbi:hypothetical protein AX769_09675 [Frondihabitans sp. PAMC 28766]|uniref:BPSS1187 family protein n=1 Tax=Frondihabitans sp. PAMC 28766 TaxID=1795630 RepID=UPI00078C9562|nr:hypothetical protein [Frondihabitans sp. PAMC 28766]AMM20372.1 hypothetical protein AX769_09675 [Frondihabitans sp. PAMC 28766]
MKFRRWPHGIVTLVLLCVAVLGLVSVETGSTGRPPVSTTSGSLPMLGHRSAGPGFGLHSGGGSGTGAGAGTGAGTGAGAGTRQHRTPPAPSKTAPPDASAPDRGDASTSQAATGSDGTVIAGAAGPFDHGVTSNPFNFRLGLIDGTVVEPDARDWAARSGTTGPLLLFLPATGHVPDDYQRFLTTAVQSGYHVLGLDFWNRGHAVANICGEDPSCYTEVQRNRFSGQGPSKFSKVDEANSVLARLHAALDYLVVHDPDGGWSQYTQHEQLDWDNIVVAGHSQGGGESAYIAHRYRVMGQLTFSSPIITDEDAAASWLRQKSATPAAKMYAFDDEHDEFYPRIVNSWNRLHLTGTLTAPVPVPATSTTHRLVSTIDLGDPGRAHIRSVSDGTPLTKKGTPVFAPVWKWMLKQVYEK